MGIRCSFLWSICKRRLVYVMVSATRSSFLRKQESRKGLVHRFGQTNVIPAEAGIQESPEYRSALDPGLRRDDAPVAERLNNAPGSPESRLVLDPRVRGDDVPLADLTNKATDAR